MPVCLIGIATIAHLAYYFPRVVDDLFISLRYAENLARGNGAVYNLGERVEGYSSPLWMLLQSVGCVLHLEGVTWTKVLGVGSLFALEYGLFRLTRDVLGVHGLLALLPSGVCALNSYLVNWSVLGLETPLHIALLVSCIVAVHFALRDRTTRSRAVAAIALVGLGMSRPESPLYVAVNMVAPFLVARSRADVVRIAKEVARFALPALLTLALLLAVRFGYYGLLVANTYFLKAESAAFDVRNLNSLWEQGASAFECVLYVGGTALLVYYAVRSRAAVIPALTAIACIYFTARVRLDWMPSLRHLLPITVLAPIGFVRLADDLGKGQSLWSKVFRVVAVAVPLAAGISVVKIDNRYSPEENRGRGWIRPKQWRLVQDTMLAYRRIEPPHVRRMGTYEMGQITQAWHVLEASAEPVANSWYVGRDIGSVGYYTGVRVFDTAGLFTQDVSRSRSWIRDRVVDDVLIRKAMARRPLAGEIYEGWEIALGRNPDLLRGYRIRRGSRAAPTAFLATDRPRPEAEEVRRRYRAMAVKFPTLFHLHTLYGESLGAVIEKRIRVL